MRLNRYTNTALTFLILLLVSAPAFSQGGDINIKKPKEYEERVLRSEKTGEKKFTLPRRFVQNTVTHYNYYYNANNKINDVLEKAKEAFKDDYSRLLPFYNYTLDATLGDSIQLDSVTYKASSGIALHDLRSDWADNLYLLWGISFHLQKKFDSAYLMFQYINYYFAPREKDGYYKTIGSSRDGNSAYSISTKEKNSLPKKIFSEPPSRNDAFIWQIKNFLVQDQFAEAASMIVTLRNDPVFPKRLKNDLEEAQAFWFYKQNMWDSSAVHLTKALDNAGNKQEKARWEYLLAQLHELSGNYKEAEKYYGKVSSHTVDPVLDIYARLYAIKVNRDGEKAIEKNVSELLKMAKRDKYSDYQDIIYYMAAQMQLEGNNTDEAMKLLLKSTQFASNNPAQRNRSFLQLAELAYNKKLYRGAHNFYDSLNLSDTSIRNLSEVQSRKSSLATFATNLDIVERQDSLQRIAAMPEDERKDFVKKLVKQIRKAQGLKDEGIGTTVAAGPVIAANTIFQSGGGNTKGEWYFYNAASKTRGQADFKTKWGNRPNVDNWRRGATIIAGSGNQSLSQQQSGNNNSQGNQSGGSTFDNLYSNLPLTAEQLQKSNDSLQEALFVLGKVLVQEIEDCQMGTGTLEQLRSRFPGFSKMDEVFFNLYYCYNKNGETAKAAAIKKLMSEKYATSNFTTIVTTGKDPQSKTSNSEATKEYEHIYDLFIEGKFDEAVAAKKAADSKYSKNYWTPQLLYIEAVYYIRHRQDSVAKNILEQISSQFPASPLAAKAVNLINVLDRRAAIEDELTRLQVTRNTDGSVTTNPTPVTVVPVQKPITDSGKIKPPVVVNNNNPKPPDTLATKPLVNISPYVYAPAEAHFVILVLNKVDPVFVNEAKNAFARYNRETYYNKIYNAELYQLDNDNRLLLISSFGNEQEAIAYVDKAKPKTPSEILPWLKGGKYSFSIITDKNLNLLKEKKDADGYKAFLEKYLPGKF
jgi:endonuclease IV/TolA-binding protein